MSDIHFGAENPAAVGAAADFVRSQGFDLMVVTGDITQIDLPRSKSSGLLEVRHILADIPGIDFHTFSGADVVRHPLVARIIEAYDALVEIRYRNFDFEFRQFQNATSREELMRPFALVVTIEYLRRNDVLVQNHIAP